MNAHLLQAIIFSLWAVLMFRLFQRAHKLHAAIALKKRKNAHLKHSEPAVPMAVRVNPLH